MEGMGWGCSINEMMVISTCSFIILRKLNDEKYVNMFQMHQFFLNVCKLTMNDLCNRNLIVPIYVIYNQQKSKMITSCVAKILLEIYV